jgi:O-acetyl-ADP-ribose deacetylase (regulator of RNase III)
MSNTYILQADITTAKTDAMARAASPKELGGGSYSIGGLTTAVRLSYTM